MKSKNILLLLFIMLLTIQCVSAVCTVTLDKEVYDPGETAEATMTCSAQQEKSQAYTLVWNNGTSVVELDNGTTPSTVNTPFFKTYQIPITGVNWTNAFANLTGTDLEGIDYFNTTDTSSNSLIINDCQFKPKAFIGSDFSVDCTVKDADGNSVDGAECVVYGTDINNAPLQVSEFTSESIDGEFVSSGLLKPQNMNEDTSYLAKIKCNCGIGDNACWNNLGTTLEKYQGSTSIGFTTARWLSMNAFVNGMQEANGRQVLTVCANVTSVDVTERVNTENYYKIWCGDNFTSTDRIVIASTPTTEPDRRGLNANQTVNHCWSMIVPEKRWLQGRTNNCLGSAEVWVLNDEGDRIKLYSDRTPAFNITIDDLGINPDWSISGDNKEFLYTMVNMSSMKYQDYNPESKSGNMDLRLEMSTPEYVDAYTDSVKDGIVLFHDFLDIQNIESCDVKYCNGTVISHNLEVTNEGFIELEVPVSDMSSACVTANVTMRTYRDDEITAFQNIGTYVNNIVSKLSDWLGRWFIR